MEKSETELKTLAKNVNDNTTFAMVGRFDDLGTLRINDNAYEQGLENNLTYQKYVGKLWYFITQSSSVLTGIQKCQAEGAVTCTINLNGVNTTYTKIITTEETVSTYKNTGLRSVAPAGEYWISELLDNPSQEDAMDTTGSNCISEWCTSIDYHNAAIRNCKNRGGHLASLAELKIASDNQNIRQNKAYYIWASNTFQSGYGYVMIVYTNGTTGNTYTRKSDSNNKKVICVTN